MLDKAEVSRSVGATELFRREGEALRILNDLCDRALASLMQEGVDDINKLRAIKETGEERRSSLKQKFEREVVKTGLMSDPTVNPISAAIKVFFGPLEESVETNQVSELQ